MTLPTKPRYRGYLPIRRSDAGWYIVEIYLASDAGGEDNFQSELITFPDKEPLMIEWDDLLPESVIQGSSATLKIISPSDRKYINLYALKPGEVWLKVYYKKTPQWVAAPQTLVWQGTLDPEFYEEPYESKDGYEVTLTFTDFGCLDRIDYDLGGMLSVHYLLYYAMERAGFPPSPSLFKLMVSSDADHNMNDLLDGIYTNSDNWYDEENTPSTLRNMMEGLLLPLGLHITQRNGHIVVFDFNSLWEQDTTEVYWSGTTQTLTTGETYNNVVITFSPYSNGDIDETCEYTGDTSTAFTWMNYGYAPIHWYSEEYDDLPDYGVDAKKVGMQFTVAYDLSQQASSGWEGTDGKKPFDLAFASFTIFFNKTEYEGCTIHSDNNSPSLDDDGLGFNKSDIADAEIDGKLYVGDPQSIGEANRNGWPKAFKIIPFAEGEEAEGIGVTMTAGRGLLENTFGYKAKDEGGKTMGGALFRYGVQSDTPWGYKRASIYGNEYLNYLKGEGPKLTYLSFLCQRSPSQPLFTTKRIYLPPIQTEDVKIVSDGGYDTINASGGSRSAYYIRLEVPMLLDCRYNPFTDATEYNQGEHQKRLTEHTRWLFIPFTAALFNGEGPDAKLTHTYGNCYYMDRPTPGRLMSSAGAWYPRGRCAETLYNRGTAGEEYAGYRLVDDDDADRPEKYFGSAWLAWYASDPISDNSTGVGGWQSNRHFFGRQDVKITHLEGSFSTLIDGVATAIATPISDDKNNNVTEPFKKLQPGQYIPYPTEGGWLEITVYAGMLGFDAREEKLSSSPGIWLNEEKGCYDRGDGRKGIYNLIRWQLFKWPTIEIVRNDMAFDSAEMDDVEYSAYLNKEAYEQLSLDTVFGTAENAHPTAKGLMYLSVQGDGANKLVPLTEMTRGPLSARPEKLLLGSLYSQYSHRRMGLTGEARLDAPDEVAPLPVWTDRSACALDAFTLPVRFYERGRCDNLRDGTTELTLMQFYPDHYSASDIVTVDKPR